MKRIVLLLGILLVGVILVGCAPEVTPVEKPEALTRELQAFAKEAWELKWERILTGAKKEGKVIIHTGVSPMTRAGVSKAFRERYGIEAEFIAGRGGDTAHRILTERRAGIYAADLIVTGTTTLISDLKPKGIFEPIIPSLILPEVTDLKYWFENKYQFADKDGLVMYLGLSPRNAIFGNSNLVKAEEIKTHPDLLHPKWKRKIAFNDPTVAGSGLGSFTLMHIAYGADFLKQLAKQEPLITRDDRLRVEWIAQGKYWIGLGGAALSRDFEKEGAPILQFELKDAVDLIPGFGAMSLLKNPPNPNATRVFGNWLLSREGQTIFTPLNDKQSIRTDIPEDIMDERSRRKPGVKYIRTANEEIVLQKDEMVRLAQEIFGPLMK